MKRVSASHALSLYGIVVGFVFIVFVLGLLIGTNGVDRRPVEPVAQSLPPVEELGTQVDFYEELSKPSDELQREEPTIIVQQEASVEEPESSPVEQRSEPLPESVVPASTGEKFTIQVAAHSNLADAQQLLIRLRAKSFEGTVSEPEPGSADRYFRVWVGEFSSTADAEVVAAQLREENFHTYIRRIN